jgi:hypothetical protein
MNAVELEAELKIARELLLRTAIIVSEKGNEPGTLYDDIHRYCAGLPAWDGGAIMRWSARLVENDAGEAYMAEMMEAPRSGSYVLYTDFQRVYNDHARDLAAMRSFQTRFIAADKDRIEAQRQLVLKAQVLVDTDRTLRRMAFEHEAVLTANQLLVARDAAHLERIAALEKADKDEQEEIDNER